MNKTKAMLRYETTSVTYCEDLLFVQHQVHRNSSDLVLLLAQPALLPESALADVAVVAAAAGGVADVPDKRRIDEGLGEGSRQHSDI